MIKKNQLYYNFNLKSSKSIVRINYSYIFKKYVNSLNASKFLLFYKRLIKNKKRFKRKTIKNLSRLLKDRKLSLEVFKQYKKYNPFKKRKKKSKSKKKKKKFTTQFKSNYYQNYLKKKRLVRTLFFFYVRKRKIKHSQHTNFLKFKNLFLKNGLVGRREILFFKILTALKAILKIYKKIRIINLLKIVFKRLTFFCELKKKRKYNNEILIPYPVSKRRGFFLGIKLLILNAKNRVENKSIQEKIALELFETFLKKSHTYKDLIKYNKMIRKNLDNVKRQKLSVFHYVD